MVIDDLQYTLYIGNDRRQWPDFASSIKQITIFHRKMFAVPAVTIVIEDTGNYVGTQFVLRDGERLFLVWGKGTTLTYDLRLASVKRRTLNNIHFYILYAYWDRETWFVDGTTKSYNGTSSQVISMIANECNLIPVVDETNDLQKWLGYSQRRYIFAKRVASKGYVNDMSLMALGVMPGDGTNPDRLLYRDLNALDTDIPVAAFVYGQGILQRTTINGVNVPLYAVTSYDIIHKGGINNLMKGYRVTQVDQGIESEDSFQENERINVRTRVPQIQRDIQYDNVQPVIETAPIKTNNTHDTFNKAQYQNNRGMTMLSNAGIKVITNRMTQINIFDPIYVHVSGTTIGASSSLDTTNEEYNGPYIVHSRIIHIEGSLYAEKIEGYREGSR